MDNILALTSRDEFRLWLKENGKKEKECWVNCVRGKPQDGIFSYLDAVEEAICFGWIDSVWKKVDGLTLQRFSPRQRNSPWTELNKERARRLIKLGRMEEGRKILPPLGPRSFRFDCEIVDALKEARVWSKFLLFPPLYQRIRIYNVAFYKGKPGYKEAYEKALAHLIEMTKKGQMYGEWNDNGRLLDY